MKYLSKREDFLREFRSINEAFDMSGSGPMGNDINWGDSLLGRLVNSIRRKIGIGSSLVRINGCIKALRREFDNIIDGSELINLEAEQKKKIGLVFIYEIIRIIEIAIYDKKQIGFTGESDGESVSPIKDEQYLEEIESMIVDSIEEIGSISDEYEVENSDVIVKYLNELLEKVKGMKISFSDKTEEGEDSESVEKSERGKESIIYISPEIEKKANLVFVENFRSVANLYQIYKNAKSSQGKQKEGESKLSDRQKDFAKDSTEELQRKLKNPQYLKYKNDIEEVIKKRVSKSSLTESILILENKNSVLSSLKSLYNVINSEGGEEAIKDIKNIQQLPSAQVIKLNTVNKLYRNIRRKLGVIQKTNEKLEVLLAKESLANAIVNLYKNSKDANLDELGELKENISKFNETMHKCLDPNLFNEVKESRRLMGYDSFLMLNENEFETRTDKKQEVDKTSSLKDSNKITLENQQPILKEYWKGILNRGLINYVLTIKEVEKIKIEIESVEKTEGQYIAMSGGSTGLDPIIEIVKIFNRAYKLHTVAVIPGGRSGGKVSNQTFREYTSFGDGRPENAGASGGPYRNNKIFNKWENAVLDIMKEKKYQPIFNKDTVIIVSGKRKKGVGLALNRFMNDLLDGDTLYQSASRGYSGKEGGAQKTFLLKYFGDIVGEQSKSIEQLDSKSLSFNGSNDAENNRKNADSIKNIEITTKSNIKIDNEDQILRSFFISKGKIKDSDGKESEATIYFHVQEISSNYFGIVYSRSFDSFNDLIRNNFKKNNVIYDDSIKKSNVTNKLFISKFKKDSIGDISDGKSITLKGNAFESSYDNKNDIDFFPNRVEFGWLYLKEESKLLKVESDKYIKNWPLSTNNETPESESK
jgi:hypothetical protein